MVYTCAIPLLLCIHLPVTHCVYFMSPAYSAVPDMSWAFSHVIYVCSFPLLRFIYLSDESIMLHLYCKILSGEQGKEK